MRNVQSGFTLIELVVVIVILGILAAVAIPKFIDLSSEANAAALDGIAGSLTSAMAINYAGCAAVSNAPTANKCVAIADCDEVGTVLTAALDAAQYTVGSLDISATDVNGASVTCTVTQVATGDTASYTGIHAGTP